MRFQVLFGLKLCHFGSNLFQIIQYCDLRDYDFAKKNLKNHWNGWQENDVERENFKLKNVLEHAKT